MMFGYVRVSTKEQNPDRQYEAMKPFKIPKANLYCDRQSGKDFQRPAYQKLLRRLQRGDVLIVKSIDRLGRNYDEILEQWRIITKQIHADIIIIDMPLLDTRVKNGDLTGTFVADLVLQILAYVAQTEREFIKQRQAEGIAIAKAKGVRFGRTPAEMPPETLCMKQKWLNGEISIRKAAAQLGVSSSTFYRYCNQQEDKSLKW